MVIIFLYFFYGLKKTMGIHHHGNFSDHLKEDEPWNLSEVQLQPRGTSEPPPVPNKDCCCHAKSSQMFGRFGNFQWHPMATVSLQEGILNLS